MRKPRIKEVGAAHYHIFNRVTNRERIFDADEKQRFSQSYNNRHDRTGTLWERRFGSLLVGGGISALSTVAAYIDLNAVRAGLVRDPLNYRWCGYFEAVAGSREAREGLGLVMLSRGQSPDWKKTAGRYRKLLYLAGCAKGSSRTGGQRGAGFSPEEVQRVLDAGGELPLSVVLRCHVRYFTAGIALGSREYAENVLNRHAERISSEHNTGPFAMTGCNWGELFTVHPLKGDVVTVPVT